MTDINRFGVYLKYVFVGTFTIVLSFCCYLSWISTASKSLVMWSGETMDAKTRQDITQSSKEDTNKTELEKLGAIVQRRLYYIQTRSYPIIKNAILLIVVIWLFLKVLLTVSDITNLSRKNNYTISNGTVKKGSTTYVKITEKCHVMLLKVHKCGSSSVQNIFLRFGYRRNLTFILAHDGWTKSETGFSNVISFKHTLSDKLIVLPPKGRHFDILCCHVIYNEEQFEKYLPEDTVYIGMVREPIKRLESALHFFRMFRNVKMSEFAMDPLKYDHRFPSMANNRMAFEFGFPKECFPTHISNSSNETTRKLTSSYLKSIDKKFDFIIINERMDESLVYMRRLLGWQLKDILYTRLLTTTGSTRKFTGHDMLKLRDYLYLDYTLYEFAVKRFEEKMANVSDDFQEEVKQFQDTNGNVTLFCKTKRNATLTIGRSLWNEKFIITLEDCKYFTLHERTFIKEIRQRQYNSFSN